MARARIAPNLVPVTRRVIVDPRIAAAYGVPTGGPSQPLEVEDLWLEQVLQGEEWIAAVRVVVGESEQPVIGELRIFPNEGRSLAFAGRWSAELLGTHARSVPRGGLPATIVRRHIELSRYERKVRSSFAMAGQLGPLVPAAREFAEYLTEAGFAQATPKQPGRSKRGRRPIPELEYARLARDYVAADSRTGKPIAELARMYNQKPATIKSRVTRARNRGFLARAEKWGKAGGVLTPKAQAILASVTKTTSGTAVKQTVSGTVSARREGRKAKRCK